MFQNKVLQCSHKLQVSQQTERVAPPTLILCQDTVILELSEEKGHRGQVLGKILGAGELASIRDTVLNNRMIFLSLHIYSVSRKASKFILSRKVQSQRLCQNTWGQLQRWNRGMLRRLSGAWPPDTIKLIELHRTPGSHGISFIKAIFKMIFTIFQILHFNNYTSQWQSYLPANNHNGLQINGKMSLRMPVAQWQW